MEGSSRRRRAALALCAVLVVSGLTLASIEGAASWAVALDAAFGDPSEPELTRFDADLGWTNIASLAVADVWGPGISVHTTPDGFRTALVDAAAPSRDAPARRERVLCSGDSFTYGQGVTDDATWCHRLGEMLPRDAVNLGVMGFGVDQAYLRYRRDAADLEHAIHVFAFIGPDLARAGRDEHHGYRKPTLRLEGESLVLEGTPVPEHLPALRRRISRLADSLRTVEVSTRLYWKLNGPFVYEPGERIARTGPLIRAIFEAVDGLGRERAVRTLFVYLPIASEVREDGTWRGFVRESFAESGLPFLDLTEPLRALDAQAARSLFIPAGAPGGGHYSARGNLWAAEHIAVGLRTLGAQRDLAIDPVPRSQGSGG